MLFLVYLDRFVHNLRPVAVAWDVAAAGARVFLEEQPARQRDGAGPPDGAADARGPLRVARRDPGDRP